MKKTPPLNVYKKIATVFVVLTVSLVFVIFYYALTYAFVTIVPNPEPVSYDVNLTVTDNAQDDLEKGIFKGTIINQELSASDTFEATGVRNFQSGQTGTVEVINTYSKPQALVKTTRLLTDKGELFRLNDSIVVPAGGKVQVEAYQDQTTQLADIKAGQKFTIPGLFSDLQQFIYAQAVSDFKGESHQIKFITKEDLDNASETLLNGLKDKISKDLSPDSLLILKPEIVSKEFSHLADEQFDNFTASIKVSMQGAVASQKSVELFERKVIEAQLNDDKEIHSFDKAHSTYNIDFIEQDNHQAQVQAHVVALAVIRKDSQILDRQKMGGLSKKELESYLENFKEIKSVSVRFFPFWVRHVPSFPDHVLIDVKSEE